MPDALSRSLMVAAAEAAAEDVGQSGGRSMCCWQRGCVRFSGDELGGSFLSNFFTTEGTEIVDVFL